LLNVKPVVHHVTSMLYNVNVLHDYGYIQVIVMFILCIEPRIRELLQNLKSLLFTSFSSEYICQICFVNASLMQTHCCQSLLKASTTRSYLRLEQHPQNCRET